VDCPDEEKFALVEKFVSLAKKTFKQENVLDIDGARVKFPGLGWALIRASNTQPIVVMRFEGNSSEALTQVKGHFEQILSQLSPRLEIPS
jgi:phosphomannomutase/phosphoglucomutase